MKLRFYCVIYAFICCLLFSCTSARKEVVRIGVLNKPHSLQSWKIRDGVSTMIGNQIHRGLLRVDPNSGAFIPEIAKNWKVDSKAGTVIFELDLSRKFSDGSPIDCNAVKLSFEKLTGLGGDTSSVLPSEAAFACLDNGHFQILVKVVPALLFDIVASPIAAIQKNDGLIGAGPYKLKIQTDQRIELTRVYGAGPNTLEFIVGNHKDLIDQFEQGRIDDLTYLGLFTDVMLPGCHMIEGISPTVFWFGLNSREKIFVFIENRRVIQRLIFLGTLKTQIFSSENKVEGLIPFGVSGSRNLASVQDVDAELQKSQQASQNLVKKYGKISFVLRDIQKSTFDWAKFFNALDPNRTIFDTTFLSNALFFEKYYKKEIPVFFVGANITRNDPFEVLSFFRKNDFVNLSGVKEGVVDNLMQSSAYADSSEKVKAFAKQAGDWVVDQGYAIPLFSKRFHGCISPALSGYRLSPLGPLSTDYSVIERK